MPGSYGPGASNVSWRCWTPCFGCRDSSCVTPQRAIRGGGKGMLTGANTGMARLAQGGSLYERHTLRYACRSMGCEQRSCLLVQRLPMLYCKWYDITCLERAPSAGPMCHMHSCLPSCTASIAETTTLGECAGCKPRASNKHRVHHGGRRRRVHGGLLLRLARGYYQSGIPHHADGARYATVGAISMPWAGPECRSARSAMGTGVLAVFKIPSHRSVSQETGYVSINLPWISKTEWHPFSLFPHPSLAGHSCIVVNKAGDWTNDLHASVPTVVSRSGFVSGPHPSPYSRAFECDKALLVASGIGITPALNVMNASVQRRCNLVWVCSDSSLIQLVCDSGYLRARKQGYGKRHITAACGSQPYPALAYVRPMVSVRCPPEDIGQRKACRLTHN
eukprot:scaffold1891_cov362-Prasinococcus_capsulatus_cf.AAC.3